LFHDGIDFLRRAASNRGMPDPSDKRKLEILGKRLSALYRESIPMRAKLQALETALQGRIPENERAAWDKELARLFAQSWQKILEEYERMEPGFAAWIDDRSAADLDSL
jgi:hypothetical protein